MRIGSRALGRTVPSAIAVMTSLVLAGAPAGASADSLSITLSTTAPSVNENVGITVTGSETNPSDLWLFIAPSGAACQPTSISEEQTAGFANPSSEGAGPFSEQTAYAPEGPGTYEVCGYVDDNEGDPPTATASASFTVPSSVTDSDSGSGGSGGNKPVLTTANAQKAFGDALASSSWSAAWTAATTRNDLACPEKDITGYPGQKAIECQVEWKYRGWWYEADGTVDADQVHRDQSGSDLGSTATFQYRHRWLRHWTVSPRSCVAEDNPPIVPGILSSNDGTCYQVVLEQNFLEDGTYTFRFVHKLYYAGTGTGFFSRWYVYNCTWGHPAGVYECTNAFGDGFRWQPYAQD